MPTFLFSFHWPANPAPSPFKVGSTPTRPNWLNDPFIIQPDEALRAGKLASAVLSGRSGGVSWYSRVLALRSIKVGLPSILVFRI